MTRPTTQLSWAAAGTMTTPTQQRPSRKRCHRCRRPRRRRHRCCRLGRRRKPRKMRRRVRLLRRADGYAALLPPPSPRHHAQTQSRLVKSAAGVPS
eukprot:364774-Chlamydomonas_euryale.AAC.25